MEALLQAAIDQAVGECECLKNRWNILFYVIAFGTEHMALSSFLQDSHAGRPGMLMG